MEVNTKILEHLKILRQLPLAVVEEPLSYKVISIYIKGYLDGIGAIYDKSLFERVAIWSAKKNNALSSNINWIRMLQIYHKEKTEEELLEIIFQTLEDYFEENPNWYKKNDYSGSRHAK